MGVGQAGPGMLSARPGSRIDVHFVSRAVEVLGLFACGGQRTRPRSIGFLFLSCTQPLFLPDLSRSLSARLYVFYYPSGHCYDSLRHNVLIAS